jgi:hypothetical protein
VSFDKRRNRDAWSLRLVTARRGEPANMAFRLTKIVTLELGGDAASEFRSLKSSI